MIVPIIATDIEFRASVAGLGGAIQAGVVSGVVNGLFDYVSAAEAAAGDVEYRCLYVRNMHATLTLYGAKVWISANTPSTATAGQIGLGTSAISGVEQTIANENTAPVGVTFDDAATEGAALLLGDLMPGQHKAVWVKRTVTAGAASYNSDGMTLSVKGESTA